MSASSREAQAAQVEVLASAASIPSDSAPDNAIPLGTTPDAGLVQAPRQSKKRRAAATEATVQELPPPDPALASHLEAILISLDRPVQPARVAEALNLLPAGDANSADDQPAAQAVSKADAARATQHVESLVRLLNDSYEASGRAFRIELLAGGYRLMTLPQFAGTLSLFHKSKANAKLSRAAVESLAIIAYKQPITRAELEAIRGVACGEVLKTLLERRLVTIRGRADELGRPMLYGTTTQFLSTFGLASIKDLPAPSELKLGS
jgi:segregation and condensation protein B